MKTRGVKYGNPEFKNLDPERKLTADEVLFVIAKFQQYGSIRRCAEAVNCTGKTAWDVIMEATEEDPRLLDNPEPMKIMGLALREIGYDLIEFQRQMTREKLENYSPRQITSGGTFSIYMGDKLIQRYREARGATAYGNDREALEAEEAKLEAELARLNESRGACAGATEEAPDTEAAEGGAGAATPVGRDTGCQDE